MTLIKRLLQWYADRSEIDLACGGTLHKNTPMLKEAADALEARDRRIAELERHVDVLRDDLSITQATLESKKTLLAACESQLAAATKRIAELEAELERERMRLAACGSAALGYFDGCKDEYKSASLDDVLRLREKLAAIEAAKNADTKHEEFKKNLAENARMSNELGYAFLQQEKSAEPVGLVDFTEFRGAVLLDGAKERVKDGDLLYTTRNPCQRRTRSRWRGGVLAHRASATNRTIASAATQITPPRNPPCRKGWCGALQMNSWIALIDLVAKLTLLILAFGNT